MPLYVVTVPITGHCLVEVDADTAEHAIELAMDRTDSDNLETWTPHRQIVRGNICYAETNEAHAEKVEG